MKLFSIPKIPQEILGAPKFEYTKNKVIVYNYKKIMKWEKKQIELIPFIIKGDNLCIKEMDKEYIIISGKIISVEIKGTNNEKKN